MRSLPLLISAVLVLAAGCGGSSVSSGSSADEVAGIVPASVPLLIALETDPESEQWRRADALLDRFPGRARVLDALRRELAGEGLDVEADVVPALGDETYVAVLDFESGGNAVVLTRPRDRAKLTELLRESDEELRTRDLDGWTAVAESNDLLDRLAAAGEKLEDAQWFRDAQERVEEDALVTLFANGKAINDALLASLPEGCEPPEGLQGLDYAAAIVAAAEDGIRFRFAAAGEDMQELLRGESLFSSVPAGAFAYLGSPGFDGSLFSLDDQLRCAADSQDVPQLERDLGFSFAGVADLFAGGFALYARSGAIIPEVTLLLSPEDDARAVATLDDLVEKGAALGGLELERRRVGDVEARTLSIGPVTILYGAGDGKVVVTTSAAGFDALTGAGAGLGDDDDFQAARDSAGVAADDEVFVYLDLRELVDLVQGLTGLAGEDLPPDVQANLAPLDSFLVWGDLSDPNNVEAGAFLRVE